MHTSRLHHAARLAVTPETICFGKFVLHPRQQLLLKDDAPVSLGSRAMCLLIAMASRPGELLEKSELIAIAWPKVFVEECNLRTQILALRRALIDQGDFEYIVTVPGLGYRFVATVIHDTPPKEPVAILPPPDTPNRVIGRADLIQTLGKQLQARRFVTLLGPGGAGKSTVALALASELSGKFPGSICFVDLAPVTSAQLIPGMIASAMGINSATDTPLQSVADTMGNSRFLLILDNCEHLLEVVATAVETLLNNAPQCCILVTSREPLHAAGEFVHHLPSLLVPDALKKMTAKQAMSYSGIQLFVERVTARDPTFSLHDSDVKTVCTICRKLDSNALAIEIAAARVQALGIQALVELLDGSFRLQMSSKDSSLDRHHTLSATLDWTYSMLSVHEQTMLRYLSIFPGSFTVDAITAIVDGMSINELPTLPLLESLVDKSLLTTHEHGAGRRLRLLETTRAYAGEKRAKLGETAKLSRLNADYALVLLRNAGEDLSGVPPQAWVTQYGPEIDTLRAALDWAYSPEGDRELGINLILLCMPLWLRLSLIGECRHWVDKGLSDTARLSPILPRQRMLLHTAAASVLLLSYGTGPKIGDYWRQVLKDAIDLNDTEHELRALWGLWSECTCSNQYQEALKLSEDYIQLTRAEALTHHRLLAKRMHASTLFHMADLAGARQSINEALISAFSPSSHIIDVHFDQRIAAHGIKAHIELLQGDVNQALMHIDENVAKSITLNHPATLWYTLCFSALPMALMAGDLPRVRIHLATMQKSIARHDLPIWRQLTRCFESILLIRQDEPEVGLRRLRETMSEMGKQGASPFYSLLRCEAAQGLAMLDLTQQALETIDETMRVASARDERWFLPELLRIKGQLLLKDATPSSRKYANELLNQALFQAENQGAEFWRARIAFDLAQSAAVTHP